MSTATLSKRRFDVVIVGAGGSGMRASLQLALAGLNVAVLSKVFPTRSHTVAAQGGIGASLGNMAEDNWHYHFYDTVKGSDWLGDQDAIEYMCREAPNVVYELEHFGMPFDRNPDGTIYQRPFGGHTANYGEKPVQRACAAADRTGHAMLHTLYQQNVKARTNFFVEWMALDLIRDADGDVLGVTALEMETGEVHILQAKTTLFATGGAGRIYAASTNAFINTGDGLGMAARAGVPLEDMEFWQFHPTGVAGAGVLLTELHGMHAGVNVVTGEFSLQADGFWIKDGAVTRALENFTVAGNFLELLSAIEMLGDDLEFNPWSGAGAPSVRVAALAVGGA